jgi:hypothetical protein
MKKPFIFNHSHFYHTLKKQTGGGIHVYSGVKQRGGGLGDILGFISRYAIPLANRYIVPHAKQFIARTATDLIDNRSNLKPILKENSKTLAKNIGKSIFDKLTQEGSGKRKKQSNSGQSPKKPSKGKRKKTTKKTNAKKPKLSKLDFLT